MQSANKDIKALSTSLTRQRADMARLNSALADTTAEKARLKDDAFSLQGQIEQVTKVSSHPFRHRNLMLTRIQIAVAVFPSMLVFRIVTTWSFPCRMGERRLRT